MENEQQRVRFIDSCYMIEDMCLNFEESNVSATKSLNELRSSISQLETIKSPSEAVKVVIAQLKRQADEIAEAIRRNEYRLECLKPVLLLIQKTKVGQDANLRYVVTMLLEAMGVVNRDAVPFEEREELKHEEAPKEENQTEPKKA